MNLRTLVIPLLLTLPVQAHQVVSRVSRVSAAVITLSYVDGQPFAHQSYELFGAGPKVPVQAGRTDAQGRILFATDAAGVWRLRAYTADGHGIDGRVEVPAANDASAATAQDCGVNTGLALLGGALLMAVFGGYQFLLRNKR